MWVICFYLNANKTAFSETVIRGCGRGDKREERKRVSLFPCPPFSEASCCSTSASWCQRHPSARFCKLTPQAASSCIPLALHFANIQIKVRTFRAPKFLFKFKIIIIIKRQKHCVSIAFFCIYENSVNSLLGASGIQLSSG